ncbi:glutathione S-transferase family protein [Parvibaculum sp.]|jgi:glutathione S-transferase|uniref:glutathione S-transferase family protein n=1 Tax=Parvibaculum sp. TaxID=2024848 RepID=UPI000C4A8BC9|nr:glutathione S-transferase family protein [Parvibaculum sp.]MAM95643.1 glutathione S-transferase [Parvibaculum sp.]|tara:strand:- start:1856 stop:2521 length:666 start_codon:yes stop_codon:yes gene_type:complete
MTLTVYGASLSPFVRKVRVFLAEKGEAYTLEQVNIFPAPDWFAEISPLKRIPVLRDDAIGADATLPDSSAICGYLEKKFSAPALYPADAFAYGKALWYEEYADSDLAGNVGMGTFRPMVVNRLMGKEADREMAEKTIAEKLPRNFGWLEKEIGAKDFLVGDIFSIADISTATHFVNFAHAGFKPDEKAYPNLTRYLAGILARPSFAACIEEETALLKKAGL